MFVLFGGQSRMSACETLTPSWILVCSLEALGYTRAGATVTGSCWFCVIKRCCDASLEVYVVEFVDSSIVRITPRRRASAS